jgi:hypothetical protein
MNRSKVTFDHDEIRRWAEGRGGKPSAVKGTARGKKDVGMIRIDFPGYSGERSLQPITWDEWFEKFDDSNLALILQDKTARGQKSHFNKLVARESVVDGHIDKTRSRRARRRSGSHATARAPKRKTSARHRTR